MMTDRWLDQTPSPAPALFMAYSDAPSLAPSLTPSIFNNYGVYHTTDNGSIDNGDGVSLLRFSIYLVFTFLVLALILYIGRAGPPPTNSGAAVAPNGSNHTTHPTQEVAKGMTPEERSEYVRNFLKTQKFVDENANSIPTGSSSFRLKKSPSSFRTGKVDDDLESCLSFGQHPSCAICLDRFQEGQDICSAQNRNCRHEFHLECIFPWLLKSQDCPCCRRDYLTVDPDVSERSGSLVHSVAPTAVSPSATANVPLPTENV